MEGSYRLADLFPVEESKRWCGRPSSPHLSTAPHWPLPPPLSWNAGPGMCAVLWGNGEQGSCLSRMYKVYFFFFLFWCISGLFPLRFWDDEMARSTSFSFQECIQCLTPPSVFLAVPKYSLWHLNGTGELGPIKSRLGQTRWLSRNPSTWETRTERSFGHTTNPPDQPGLLSENLSLKHKWKADCIYSTAGKVWGSGLDS